MEFYHTVSILSLPFISALFLPSPQCHLKGYLLLEVLYTSRKEGGQALSSSSKRENRKPMGIDIFGAIGYNLMPWYQIIYKWHILVKNAIFKWPIQNFLCEYNLILLCSFSPVQYLLNHCEPSSSDYTWMGRRSLQNRLIIPSKRPPFFLLKR